MPPQQRPICCPVCTAPVLIVNESFTCGFCKITEITWKPFKSLDRIKFTDAELKDMEAKEKERQKQMTIQINKQIHKEKMKILEQKEREDKESKKS